VLGILPLEEIRGFETFKKFKVIVEKIMGKISRL
jgi:hypothetical protein